MKKAFTLAEVLITLGIIGIVAAMTLPALIQKNNEKQTVVKLKKVYSILQQAQQNIINEYGTFDNLITMNADTGEKDEQGNTIIDYTNTNLIKFLFAKYLKVAKTCESGVDCLGKPVYYLSGKLQGTYLDPSLILTDGTKIFFGWTFSPCSKKRNCLDVGVALPSMYNNHYTVGKDIFYFSLYSDKIVPEDNMGACKISGTGRGCAAWVIINENMDYLYCRDLAWGKKTKCK